MLSKVDLEKQRDFLLGYNDAKSMKTVYLDNKSIDYVKGYSAFMNSLTKPIDDFQRGYDAALSGQTVMLDNESAAFIEGFMSFQNKLTDALNNSDDNKKFGI